MSNMDDVFETVNDNYEHPLDGFHPMAEPVEREELTTRDAADSLIRKREEEAPLKDYIDPIEFKKADGTKQDPKAYIRQSELRSTAEGLNSYRSQRDQWLSDLTEQARQAGQEGQEAEATQQPQEAPQPVDTGAEEERTRALQQAQSAHAQAERLQHEGLVKNTILEIQRLALTEFPDVKTPADLLELRTSNPNRFARFAQLDTAFQQAGGIAHQLMQQTTAAKQQEWQSFGKEQDKIFEDLHPEFKSNPESMAKAQRITVDYLTNELGMTRDDLTQLYSTNRAFRSAAGQQVLYDAAQWREAQKNARSIPEHRKPVPPVQRPGVARDRGEDTERSLASLRGRLDRTGNLRDGVRLLMASRNVRSR